ncbi:MAG: MiaB/RimO family radical SAM methylthiotransferase [Candidatus Eremiobacteraeota bacterium]|nr:MiaB/RimO family radical SAM methylthiotransferase [Candidatus Eremiobacteraeota bacterium]MCW5871575.1 MiaB/RimO family radical SAM methylthiotransferase [Candidatus Eremiobacteraeota bacterium]
MPTFSIHTLGCRANQADSEQLAQILLSAGFEEVAFGQPADCQVINTCTVTREADRKSAQMVRRAARLGEQVVVTGCGAAQKGGAWQRVPSTALRLPPDQREQILEKIGAQHCPSGERLERNWLRRDRARALLRIQEGCDQFCTFCIVPYVRGRARSQTREWVLEQVLQLGAQEVVLSGIHLSAWGRERDEDLADLLEFLLARSEGIRYRLSSVEPDLFPRRVFELMDERLCPHLHLVLQHASDSVLQRMHRGYQLADYDALVQEFLARVPGASLTTDLMVGFPGETDQDFETLMDYVRRTPFARIHVFPYSQRPGTSAARFPDQVPEAVCQIRRDRLLKLAERKRVAFQRQNLGQVREALVESESERPGWMKATSDNFLPLLLRGGPALRGKRLLCRLQRRWGEQIIAVVEEGF